MENSVVTLGLVFAALQIIIAAFTAWFMSRRIAPQNETDNSKSFLNYSESIVTLQKAMKDLQDELEKEKVERRKERAAAQAEIEQARAETKAVRELMENSHIEIEMRMEIGGAPVIKGYKWMRRTDDKEKPL